MSNSRDMYILQMYGDGDIEVINRFTRECVYHKSYDMGDILENNLLYSLKFFWELFDNGSAKK